RRGRLGLTARLDDPLGRRDGDLQRRELHQVPGPEQRAPRLLEVRRRPVLEVVEEPQDDAPAAELQRRQGRARSTREHPTPSSPPPATVAESRRSRRSTPPLLRAWWRCGRNGGRMSRGSGCAPPPGGRASGGRGTGRGTGRSSRRGET